MLAAQPPCLRLGWSSRQPCMEHAEARVASWWSSCQPSRVCRHASHRGALCSEVCSGSRPLRTPSSSSSLLSSSFPHPPTTLIRALSVSSFRCQEYPHAAGNVVHHINLAGRVDVNHCCVEQLRPPPHFYRSPIE